MPIVAVVIPCYKVTRHILDVISNIESDIHRIYVVDDACPDGTGNFVMENCIDTRLTILTHNHNQGVGAAVMTGYKAAADDGADIIVKIDGDGQMDPNIIPRFIAPILAGDADYTKGNRFFFLEDLESMPKVRLFGNSILSFMSKLSSGYWDIFDPTNGYTAIHAEVVRHLPFKKISSRYFFETDILFRLNTLRAVVIDIPMRAKYSDEVSGLKISKIITEFFVKHARNLVKRIFYNYYLRDMSLASIELPIGLLLFIFGIGFGGYHWYLAAHHNYLTPVGTVMIAALPALVGLQLILSFLAYDINSIPRRPLHRNYFPKLGR